MQARRDIVAFDTEMDFHELMDMSGNSFTPNYYDDDKKIINKYASKFTIISHYCYDQKT